MASKTLLSVLAILVLLLALQFQVDALRNLPQQLQAADARIHTDLKARDQVKMLGRTEEVKAHGNAAIMKAYQLDAAHGDQDHTTSQATIPRGKAVAHLQGACGNGGGSTTSPDLSQGAAALAEFLKQAQARHQPTTETVIAKTRSNGHN